MQDVFKLGGHEFHSRFILGSGKYDLKLIVGLLTGWMRKEEEGWRDDNYE